MKYFLSLGLLLLSGTLYAQTVCPPGMIPYGAGVCGYDNSQQQQQQPPQQQPQPAPPQWARRWGAIATDEPKGILGAVTDMASKSDAERSAMADCQTKGGARCKLEIAYDNECAALIVSDKGYNTPAAATVDQAIKLGMKTCTDSGDTNCHVYYSDCSLPVRIQ